MSKSIKEIVLVACTISALACPVAAMAQTAGAAVRLAPGAMAKIGTVDDRYQSYNIEMIQVMGGKWWAPYSTPASNIAPAEGRASNAGFGGSTKAYRAPTDLANPKLRTLAAALSPAYVRVTDTWANSVYFQDNADPPAPPPPGFSAVITAPQWKGVIDFSNALDTKIVTSFSISAGVRDTQGVWTPVEAQKLLAFMKLAGGSIAAAEFYNEPNLGVISGAPKNYGVQDYARDFKIFHDFVKKTDPAMEVLGPGPVGEDQPLPGLPPGLKSEDLMRATGSELDGVSYHFYGAVSQRCAAFGPAFQTTPEAALSKEWLMATTKRAAFYGDLRDRYAPAKPLWLSETADAACGGNPWATSFLDSFRYLNQLGVLAKQGVHVVMHNTLAGSDYGLISDVTLNPRPNYWAAVLWRKLMDKTVLEAQAAETPNLYVYAACLRGQPGGVSLLLINADRAVTRKVYLPIAASRYSLTSADFLSSDVDLNGRRLALTSDNSLPPLQGVSVRAGVISLAPTSISFLAIPGAANGQCR